jgi:G protein-coupled receptor 64/G protein-coupled receptor 126
MAHGKPLAVGECVGNFTNGAEWMIVTLHSCVGSEIKSNVTQELHSLYQEKVNAANIDYVMSSLARLTSPFGVLMPVDVAYALAILNSVQQSTSSRPVEDVQVVENLLTSFDNLAQVNTEILLQAQNRTHSASRIVSTMEAIMNEFKLPTGTSNMTVSRSNVVVQIWDLPGAAGQGQGQPDRWIYGFSVANLSWISSDDFRYIDVPTLDYMTQQSESVILLSQEALNKGQEFNELVNRPFDGSSDPPPDRFRVSFTVYRSGDFFTVPSTDTDNSLSSQLTANSLVISAAVGGVKLNNLTQPITVKLRLIQPGLQVRQQCAYWDHDKQTWSTDGVLTSSYNVTSTSIVCYSQHLTNFAVIAGFDLATDTVIARVLQTISIIGLMLSIIGLSMTILSQIILYKNIRKSRSPMVLLHLSISLLAVDILVLVGLDRTGSVAGCKAVSALLLYFLLVSFSWMLVEAVLQYLRFVKVLDTYIEHFMLKAALPAWIVPGLIVATVAVIDIKINLLSGSVHYCWLSMNGFYFAFLIPLGLVMVTNIIFFILIIKGLTCDRPQGLQSTQTKNELVQLQLLALICCFILMGLTWIFALFAVINSAALVMQILFCVFNSLQGFLIFLFLNIRDKSVRKARCSLFTACHRHPVHMSRHRGECEMAQGRFKDTGEEFETMTLKGQIVTMSENGTTLSSRVVTS